MAGNAGGAFTGLYQGAGGAADAAAALRPLLPGISVYQQGSSSAPALQNQITTPPITSTYSSGGNLDKFAHFLGGIATQTGHIAGEAASWLKTNTINLVEAPVKLGAAEGHGILDHMDLSSIQTQNQQLTGKMNTLMQQFKQGKITSTQYKQGINDIAQDFDNLDKQSKSLSNRTQLDQKSATSALINTATDLVTILTAGLGKAGTTAITAEGLRPVEAATASDWLAGTAAKPLLDPVINTISRVASQPEVYKSLDVATQAVLQRSTAEVVATAGETMTASQIARATAVNVALKYPIYFNMLSSTGQQVYSELDQGKYGEAIRTLAFNAALLLSGGPIGQALKVAGKGAGLTKNAIFGQSSFWDELSKFYGDQSPAGFTSAISKMATGMDATAQKEFIHNLSTVEQINLQAVKGDAIAAASRVAKGMQGTYSFDLSTVSHEAAIEDMVKFAKNFRLADDAAKQYGLGNVAVGRVDARDLNTIAEKVGATKDSQTQLDAWHQLKAANPNQAWANNANFDKQITTLIASSEPGEDIGSAIRNIKAQFEVEGFPKTVADKMAKDGYFPIKPKNLEAPFKEGSDTLGTKFANGEDFFTKAVQPLPVLGSVGQLFTHLGLSPDNASSRAYEYFNDYLSKNLEESGVINKIANEDIHQQSDVIIKQLSDYAHGLKLPVSDLRQLSSSQIQKALGVSAQDARRVQQAIVKANLDVPLAVRGLGDRAVDWTYGMPTAPITRTYLKIQGALRFSFNPFFQYLRVIPKTEILSEAEGGGYLSSVFAGRSGEISQIRDALRSGGLLDEVGSLRNGVLSGEAVDSAGASVANLNKKLLPMQERSVAGLIDSQAQRLGMSWQDYIQNFPQETRDTIQMITQYDRNANYLNSPLARTLNIAFFPSRFDTKVATIFARNLAKTSTLTQVAVINGMFKAHAFLNSPEGQAWYAKNSLAIGLFNYITPLASMAEVFESLVPGHDHSLGNFGELGGLPFGWLPQLLDAEGLTHFNQPGVSAATGTTYPDYIPKTLKGQTAVAIQDLLGSLFSYPGATAGLPSKTSITRNFAIGVVGANKTTDFSKQTPQISAEQTRYEKNVQTTQGTVAPVRQPLNTSGEAPNTQQVTPSSTSANVAAKAKASTKKKALKKSDITPIPAPGQSALGVL